MLTVSVFEAIKWLQVAHCGPSEGSGGRELRSCSGGRQTPQPFSATRVDSVYRTPHFPPPPGPPGFPQQKLSLARDPTQWLPAGAHHPPAMPPLTSSTALGLAELKGRFLLPASVGKLSSFKAGLPAEASRRKNCEAFAGISLAGTPAWTGTGPSGLPTHVGSVFTSAGSVQRPPTGGCPTALTTRDSILQCTCH